MNLIEPDINVPKTKKYEEEVAFNPFLHGTNTSIFSILPKSEFNIMSPLEMMDKYQAVSMTGELMKGGYNNISSPIQGKTSFGIMSSNNYYSLENIISNYANQYLSPNPNDLEKFKEYAQDFRGRTGEAFSEINLLLIYFTRARQMHHSLEEVITEEELNTLREQLEGASQFFYFIQLLGTYIHPNFEAIEQYGIKKDIGCAAYEFLTDKNIIDKIIKNKINMKEIVANPTSENLSKALSVLELPNKCTLSKSVLFEKDIELPITQFFCLEPKEPNIDFFGALCNCDDGTTRRKLPSSLPYDPAHDFIDTQGINQLLEKVLQFQIHCSKLNGIDKIAKQRALFLGDHIRLFEKLVNAPQSRFNLTALQRYFLQKKFPIVLVSENKDKIALINNETSEYRSNSALKLGYDIKIIATDTHEHRLEIMKYLALHHINNIQIVLFDDLRASKNSHKKPDTPHHHSDGVPTLKWLSAQRVSSSDLMFFKGKKASSRLENGGMTTPTIHSEKNHEEVTLLLDNAQKYHAIDFTKLPK